MSTCRARPVFVLPRPPAENARSTLISKLLEVEVFPAEREGLSDPESRSREEVEERVVPQLDLLSRLQENHEPPAVHCLYFAAS